MTGAFEASDQGGEPRTDQAGTARCFVDGSIVDLLAFAAPARLGAEFDHPNEFRRDGQIDLLNNFGW